MRISDWSSDVCSSDLTGAERHHVRRGALKLACVLDQDHPLVEMRHLGEQCVGERSLTRAGAASDEDVLPIDDGEAQRSEEHTSELQSLMRISYAVFCLKKKTKTEHTL